MNIEQIKESHNRIDKDKPLCISHYHTNGKIRFINVDVKARKQLKDLFDKRDRLDKNINDFLCTQVRGGIFLPNSPPIKIITEGYHEQITQGLQSESEDDEEEAAPTNYKELSNKKTFKPI